MKKIYILAAASLALAACDNNDDYPSNSKVEAHITASIGESISSRAVDTQWAENDKIGITTTFNSKVGPFINMEYTTAGNGKFDGTTIYIYNPMSISAYYPFNGTEGTAPGVLSASTKAEYQTPAEQAKFDYLFASIDKVDSDHPNIDLTFAHKMCKLTFQFNNGDGATGIKITSYKIEGLVLDGTFNTATGVCAANANATAQPLSISVTGDTHGKPLPPLIVFPQKPGTVTLKLHDNENQDYACTLNFGNDGLLSGNNYQFTITVSKTGLSVNSTISDWVTNKIDTGAESDWKN